MATTTRLAAPKISDEDLEGLLELLKGADSVELKLTVPDRNLPESAKALGVDSLDAQVRQVFFFDTPDLALYKQGVVVRARRVQRKGDDSVVKLRPVVPDELPKKVRNSPGFGVEVDAMPGAFVCSGSMKRELERPEVRDAVLGEKRVRSLFTKEQRAFYADHAPEGLEIDDLSILGPIFVLKVKFSPEGFKRRMVGEVWLYPDGSRIVELSTKCPPRQAFDVAAETRGFLTSRGIDLSAAQETKTRKALEFFSKQLQKA
jgi:hypothetical protein